MTTEPIGRQPAGSSASGSPGAEAPPTSLVRRSIARLSGPDSAWLVWLIVAAALVLLVGWVAEEALEGDTSAFDRRILLAFRRPDDPARLIGPPWLPDMVRDVTALGSTVVLALVLLIVAGFLAMTRKFGALALVLVAVLGGEAISTMLKLLVDRARPDLIPGAPMTFNASFPSGHAMLSAVTYLTIGALLARMTDEPRLRRFFRATALGLTLLVGVSRVALGVHWPTDVLAGWCVGAAWAILCVTVAGRLRMRGEVERVGR